MNTPTPLPWRYNPRYALIHNSKQGYIEGSKTVCNMNTNNENEQANAELIVRAVNYHDRLVECLKQFAELSKQFDGKMNLRPKSGTIQAWGHTEHGEAELTVEMLQAAQQLLTEIEKSK